MEERNNKLGLLGLYLMAVIALIIWASLNVYTCVSGGGATPPDTISVRVDSVIDTLIVEVHDTLPVWKRERVTAHVPPVPTSPDTLPFDRQDSLAVVQREYTDDSTYIAYVSGIKYEDWPKLDSIIVQQREVTRRIKETVTVQPRKNRWKVGFQAGYGYGVKYKGFEPYIGFGVTYSLFPP
jgi:hypothetical protein